MDNGRSFDADFAFSRRYLRHMKAIVGANLIGEAPEEEDRHHNTDLVVFRLETKRIACRVRQHRYFDVPKYRDEFTIRTSRPSGVASELLKIMRGWGDYILYGFAAPSGDRLCAWVLGDLYVFREWYFHQMVDTGAEPGERQTNGDGSSNFRAYRIGDLPAAFVVDRKVLEPVLL